jgi:hypothetical protein
MIVDSSLGDKDNKNVGATDPVDGLDYSLDGGGVSHGTLDFNTGNGGYSYTPYEDYYGQDSFGYKVDDNDGGTDEGTVTINIFNNDPKAIIDGEDSLDYCENETSELRYSGLGSNDKQINNGAGLGEDGDDGSIENYGWTVSPYDLLAQDNGYEIILEGPVDYNGSAPWTSDGVEIGLNVEDDEEALSSKSSLDVSVDEPAYDATVTEPTNPRRIWMTANSNKRSEKLTVELLNMNGNPDFKGSGQIYDINDIEFQGPQVDGKDVWIFNPVDSNTLEIWAQGKISPGTYDITGDIVLDLPSFPNNCSYKEETIEFQLRAQTISEY